MRLTRRSLLQSAPLFAQASGPPPNFVFLISDDHSQPDLGCYGNTVMQTPHLDRMAREGVRFNNCFVTSPQCSPNRSSIFTGCAPHTTSTSRLHTPLPDYEPSFLEPLKEKGYFVGAFRKVHQGPSFDKRWDYYGSPKASFEEFFDKLPSGRPFFLHVGFSDPHRPYQDGTIPNPHDPAKIRVPAWLPDTPEIRKDLALYHDEIARMDSECGQILSILQKRGLGQNTCVVFTGDNGMPFPRAKGTCYDAGINVPLIFRWPSQIKPAVTDQLVSHVDLPVTWLELAGIPKPAKMQGRSIRTSAPRTEVFSERNWHDNFDPIRSVRTARHKLIFNAAPHFPYRPAWDLENSPTWKSYLAESRRGRLSDQHMRLLDPTRPLLELYDLQSDPHEFHNLAADPAHQETLADLKRRLSQWMHDTLDFLPPGKTRPNEPGGREWPMSL
ncbi:MAG: sulfatase [Acidimicrobiia bacterium]|nr:sulfatase [Acidimicrobiia bacterium]